MPRRFDRLTRNEIQLLQELRVADGRSIASLVSSIEVAHLIGAGYIERLPAAVPDYYRYDPKKI
jgi:hypothetical protein